MRTHLAITTLCALLLASCAVVEGDAPGECSDGADNGRDGWFDCDDSDCCGDSECEGDDPPDAVLAGDVNGDALGDIVIGAPLSDGSVVEAGAAYLWFGLGL